MPSAGAATAEPTARTAWINPIARPWNRTGYNSAIRPIAAGVNPPPKMPTRARGMISPAMPVAEAVAAVARDKPATTTG